MIADKIQDSVRQTLNDIPEMEWEQDDDDDIERVRFVTGRPFEVAVDITKDEILIHRWAARWEGPHSLVDAPEVVGRIDFKSHGRYLDEDGFSEALKHLVLAAQMLRRMRFSSCKFCDKTTPPEYQYGEDVCYGCASTEYGIVY